MDALSSHQTKTGTTQYQGTDKLILGIVLAVITFWLLLKQR